MSERDGHVYENTTGSTHRSHAVEPALNYQSVLELDLGPVGGAVQPPRDVEMVYATLQQPVSDTQC